MKLTKRKGFNFFRSYYDVYNELENPEDKIAFIDALLDRQFLGIKPEGLKGMAKFAYISQTNSIDSQVKGYNDKQRALKNPLLGEVCTPTQGGKNNPTLQVKEKGKEQGEEQVQVKDEEKGKYFDDVFLSVENCKEKYLKDGKIIKAVCGNTKNNISEIEIEERLNKFNTTLTEKGDYSKTFKDYCSHFLSWHKLNKSKTNGKLKTKGFL